MNPSNFSKPIGALRRVLAVVFLIQYAMLPILQPTRSLAAVAEEEKEEPFLIEGLSTREQELLFHGIALGISVSNMTLENRGLPRLYCPPADFGIGSDSVWAAANRAMKGGFTFEYASFVPMAVLEELYAEHPCGKKKTADEIRLEQQEGLIRQIDRMESAVTKAAASRRAECIEHSGSPRFCQCLGENLGWQIPYDRYREIEDSSKHDLGYASLDVEDRAMADHIWAVHDECFRLKE